MDRNEIAERLDQAVLRTTQARGVRLGHGNEYELPEMARRAADRILETAADEDEQHRLTAEGEGAFTRLVDEMVVAARAIEGYPAGVIGEQTLEIALGRIGPFPPFW